MEILGVNLPATTRDKISLMKVVLLQAVSNIDQASHVRPTRLEIPRQAGKPSRPVASWVAHGSNPGPHIFGSTIRLTTLPQALFFFQKNGPPRILGGSFWSYLQ